MLAKAQRGRLRSLWASLSVLATVAFLLAGGALVGFVALTDEVLEGETEQVDHAVLRALEGMRLEWLDPVALEITALGNIGTVVIVSLSAGAILWAAGRKVSFVLLLASVVTGILLNHVLKLVFDRPRPEVVARLAETATTSFPSGHAMLSAVTYGAVAFLVGRMARGGVRWATWLGAALLVILIGSSRVYVGVHYPSDVLAGWLAGVAWTALLVALFRVLGVFSRELPELERAEPDLE